MTLYCGCGDVPVPVRGTTKPGPETYRLPPCVTAAGGVKVTFTVTLCPAPRVNGSAGPLIKNPLPIVWNVESVVFCERVLESTTGIVELVPIATWPNDTIEGLALKDSLLTPVPSTPSTKVGLEALLEKASFPPVHPIAVGVKLTLRSKLCPEAKTSGRLKVDGVNAELLIANPETVTLVASLFVTVTIKVSLCPITTAAKRRIVGEHESRGAALALPGAIPTSAITMPIVRKLNGRTEKYRRMDWGSLITASLRSSRREGQIPEVQQPVVH